MAKLTFLTTRCGMYLTNYLESLDVTLFLNKQFKLAFRSTPGTQSLTLSF